VATVTLHVGEDLLEKANKALANSALTLDEVFSRALEQLSERAEHQRQFEEMAADFHARGLQFPILTREERNARR